MNDNPTQRAAVQSLVANGIAVIVAAGNDASLEVSQQVPATYPEVIAIASTTAKAGTNSYIGFSGVIGADTASYIHHGWRVQHHHRDRRQHFSANRNGAVSIGSAPLNSPTTSYTFDGVREGVLSASGALAR